MDKETCMQKMQLVGVLAFATVDEDNKPQVRNISAIHYEKDAIYFYTAKGKNFCRELLANENVQILAYTRFKEMIRMSAKAIPVADNEQEYWKNVIFTEQPYLENVYPGETKDIGIMFVIRNAEIEYFNLGVNPIFRETYILGNTEIHEKGYHILADQCIGCGKCMRGCPQRCITQNETKKCIIEKTNCLHCGRCKTVCPVQAIERIG
jgi:uncharacterized pyridoxamine 5'-phosphate oxidase family protein/Pyruvate/2-oxoacid:ferredoxin oxidoreductase delta subunit